MVFVLYFSQGRQLKEILRKRDYRAEHKSKLKNSKYISLLTYS